MEIGSEFWINLNDNVRINTEIPKWLSRFGEIVLTASGRSAISLILDQISPICKVALLPSYICQSVIKPFEVAGFELIYYDLDESFAPQLNQFTGDNIGVFLHMGYFGFQTNENLSEVIRRFKSQSVIIVEDVTQTLFNAHKMEIENDFVFGSIRKWFGLPSGGFAAAVNKSINSTIPEPPTELIKLRLRSLNLKYSYIQNPNSSLKEEYLAGFISAEQMFDEDNGIYRMDSISEQIIRAVDTNYLINKRVRNFEYLLKKFITMDGIKPIFDSISENTCPFFFPVLVCNDRDRLKARLIENQIYCPIHWPIPEQIKNNISSGMMKLYDSILSIPCDQRYNFSDMERIVCVMKECI